MLPFQSNNGLGSGEEFLVQGLELMEMEGGALTSNSRSTPEIKTKAASKSHSEAEKQRRERINGHLATLRTLLPNATKTDKASLLAEVVQYVKVLKRHAAEMVSIDVVSGSIWSFPFPGEADEVTLDADPESSLIKATVCCDDRPDLLSDLNGAIRSLSLRAVKAEMATLGGRTKSIFLIEGGGYDHLSAIRRALKSVLERPASADAGVAVSSSHHLPFP